MDQPTLDTLYALYLAPRTVQSDFARQWAEQLAALASQSLITTKEAKDTYGRLWRITPVGQNQLIAHGLL
jgi:hypothetical protein